MLSDEEKKAMEIVKGLAVYYDDYGLLDEEEIKENEEVNNSINIVLNLIKKQSKEIEELKDTRSIFNMGRRSYKNEIEYKIKAKIEDILNSENGEAIEKLIKWQSLLEKE